MSPAAPHAIAPSGSTPRSSKVDVEMRAREDCKKTPMKWSCLEAGDAQRYNHALVRFYEHNRGPLGAAYQASTISPTAALLALRVYVVRRENTPTSNTTASGGAPASAGAAAARAWQIDDVIFGAEEALARSGLPPYPDKLEALPLWAIRYLLPVFVVPSLTLATYLLPFLSENPLLVSWLLISYVSVDLAGLLDFIVCVLLPLVRGWRRQTLETIRQRLVKAASFMLANALAAALSSMLVYLCITLEAFEFRTYSFYAIITTLPLFYFMPKKSKEGVLPAIGTFYLQLCAVIIPFCIILVAIRISGQFEAWGLVWLNNFLIDFYFLCYLVLRLFVAISKIYSISRFLMTRCGGGGEESLSSPASPLLFKVKRRANPLPRPIDDDWRLYYEEAPVDVAKLGKSVSRVKRKAKVAVFSSVLATRSRSPSAKLRQMQAASLLLGGEGGGGPNARVNANANLPSADMHPHELGFGGMGSYASVGSSSVLSLAGEGGGQQQLRGKETQQPPRPSLSIPGESPPRQQLSKDGEAVDLQFSLPFPTAAADFRLLEDYPFAMKRFEEPFRLSFLARLGGMHEKLVEFMALASVFGYVGRVEQLLRRCFDEKMTLKDALYELKNLRAVKLLNDEAVLRGDETQRNFVELIDVFHVGSDSEHSAESLRIVMSCTGRSLWERFRDDEGDSREDWHTGSDRSSSNNALWRTSSYDSSLPGPSERAAASSYFRTSSTEPFPPLLMRRSSSTPSMSYSSSDGGGARTLSSPTSLVGREELEEGVSPLPYRPPSAHLAAQPASAFPSRLLFLRRLFDALARLHEAGMVHRDIKPGNICCAPHDDTIPVLIDFGISYIEGRQEDRCLEDGTEIYMPPECVEARKEREMGWFNIGPFPQAPNLVSLLLAESRGAPADVWAAALVAAEFLTGAHHCVLPHTSEEKGIHSIILWWTRRRPGPPLKFYERWEEGDARAVTAMLQKEYGLAPCIGELLSKMLAPAKARIKMREAASEEYWGKIDEAFKISTTPAPFRRSTSQERIIGSPAPTTVTATPGAGGETSAAAAAAAAPKHGIARGDSKGRASPGIATPSRKASSEKKNATPPPSSLVYNAPSSDSAALSGSRRRKRSPGS